MIWNADLAIVYACALTLLGGLVLWALPTLFFALAEAVRSWSQRALAARSEAQPRSRIPARSSHYPHPVR